MKTTLCGLALIAALAACQSDNDAQLLPGQWQLERLTFSGRELRPSKNYILKLEPNQSASLRLDVNNCSGFYRAEQSGRIRFSQLGCTEACCDSEVAERWVQMLVGANAYDLQGCMLTIAGGIGMVELKRQN